MFIFLVFIFPPCFLLSFFYFLHRGKLPMCGWWTWLWQTWSSASHESSPSLRTSSSTTGHLASSSASSTASSNTPTCSAPSSCWLWSAWTGCCVCGGQSSRKDAVPCALLGWWQCSSGSHPSSSALPTSSTGKCTWRTTRANAPWKWRRRQRKKTESNMLFTSSASCVDLFYPSLSFLFVILWLVWAFDAPACQGSPAPCVYWRHWSLHSSCAGLLITVCCLWRWWTAGTLCWRSGNL